MINLIIVILLLFLSPDKDIDEGLQNFELKSGKISYKIEGRKTGSQIILFDDFGSSYYEYNCTKILGKEKIISIDHLMETEGSDHCPIILDIIMD